MPLSKELKEEIRKLQREGKSDYQISKMLYLPYAVVAYQRPEVREEVREHLKWLVEKGESPLIWSLEKLLREARLCSLLRISPKTVRRIVRYLQERVVVHTRYHTLEDIARLNYDSIRKLLKKYFKDLK